MRSFDQISRLMPLAGRVRGNPPKKSAVQQ
jgi:hypothetical protein